MCARGCPRRTRYGQGQQGRRSACHWSLGDFLFHRSCLPQSCFSDEPSSCSCAGDGRVGAGACWAAADRGMGLRVRVGHRRRPPVEVTPPLLWYLSAAAASTSATAKAAVAPQIAAIEADKAPSSYGRPSGLWGRSDSPVLLRSLCYPFLAARSASWLPCRRGAL